jgi:hypothetical protein
MVRIVFTCSCILFCLHAKAQDSTIANLADLKEKLKIIVRAEESRFKNTADLILNDPAIYNEVWNKVYNAIRDSSQPLFKNLKLQFKTFQASDSDRTSLGFGYSWDYDINRKVHTAYKRSGFNAKLHASGNIAFKKALNPVDFQQAKILLGKFGFLGGTVNRLDREAAKKLTAIKQQLALIEGKRELAGSPLWNELTKAMGIKNHYHYNIGFAAGWEGSQDFSRSQVSYGAQARFSAKSYSDDNALSQFNILDYPFALIRYLTGTDASITPYGATLPIITAALDVVKPAKDTIRKKLTGDEKQFVRFRFETGFRTLVANLNDVPIHFNAAYRYYHELNAPRQVKAARLNWFSYFTCSLTGNDTYFVSYSYGNLPFDQTSNAVYEIGFKFNL